MKYLEYPLYEDGYINHFISTGVFTEVQQFKKNILHGRVNEWLKKGFSIHENPCRKEFLEKRAKKLPEYIDISQNILGENISLFNQINNLKVYFPFGNIGMDESAFYYRPTYLRTYCYANLQSPQDEKADFCISTCGGLTIWLNDQLIEDYIPFTRNMVKSQTISLPLQQGENKLIICLDDLAERDTDYYFHLKYLGKQELTIKIPIHDGDIEKVHAAEEVLASVFFEKDSFISEEISLHLSNVMKDSFDMNLTIVPGEFIEKMINGESLLKYKKLRIDKNQQEVILVDKDEMHPGYCYFVMGISIGNILVQRKIGTEIVRNEYLYPDYSDIELRKVKALQLVCANDVDNVYKAVALLRMGLSTEKAEAIILEEVEGIKQRRDCSDFHFVILLYIYHTYHALLSDEVIKTIQDTMLGYRYWIDEPGDDVMWFFSENHALLFHICQYLAGTYLPDHIFSNSKDTGHILRKKGENHLNEWFENFFNEFITEWNSNAYIPVDVLGIGTLYNLTLDNPRLHDKAKQALDMISYSLAINEHKGAIMTSFGRSYEKELKGNYNAGTTSLLYVLYNTGYLNRAALAYISIVLGDYQPPEEYRKYLQLSKDEELIHQNTQGFEQHVNLYLYKNSKVALSTAIDFKADKNGYQEHIVQATIDETAHIFINHPGESQPYGNGRPNFWAGNGTLPLAVQYENLSILRYNISNSNRIDYTHAYIPISGFKRYSGTSSTIVLEKDGGLIGVRALNGLRMQEKGPCRHREFISDGRQNIWVVKVAKLANYADINEFQSEMESMEITYNVDEVTVIRDAEKVYEINNSHELIVNGKKVHHYPLDVKGILELRGQAYGNSK